MRKISELSEKEINEAIHRVFPKVRPKNLTKLARAGVPPVALATILLTIIKEGRSSWMSAEMKETFRQRQRKLKTAAVSLEPLPGWEHVAASMMNASDQIGASLRKNGQKDGVDLLVRALSHDRYRFCGNSRSRQEV